MSKINEIIKKEAQQMGTLPQSLPQHSLKRIDGGFEMSTFTDDVLTPKGVATAFKRIQSAFPQLDTDFHSVLAERIKEKGIGDKQLIEAVNNVVDSCEYPKPTIAQFLSFNKMVKLFNYDQMIKKNNDLNGRAFSLYSKVKINGVTKPMWASNQDIELYNLTPFKHETKTD